jgi:hypothetical protein
MGNDDFLNGLADFDELSGSSFRMRLQLSPRRPLIGFVVMIHVAEQQAIGSFVDDQPDILADAHGVEVGVPRSLEFVQLKAGVSRVQLQIEGCRFDRLLFLSCERDQAIGERIRDPEFHGRGS